MQNTTLFEGKPESSDKVPLIVLSVCLCGLGLLGFYGLFTGLTKNESTTTSNIIFTIVSLLTISPLIIFFFYKPVPKLIVDNSSIYYGDRIIRFSRITNMVIDAQMRSWGNTYEVVQITLDTEEQLTINIDQYEHSYLFRSVCKTIWDNARKGIYSVDNVTPAVVKIDLISFEALSDENFQQFLRSPFYSVNTYIAIASFGISLFTVVRADIVPIICYGIPIIFCAAYLLTERSYFLVSPNYLVIRNRLLNKQITIIAMSDIVRITKGTDHNASDMLIMTKDYKFHFASTDTWLPEANRLIETVNSYISK